MLLWLLTGCLVDEDLYRARLAELSTVADSGEPALDADGDGWTLADGDCDDGDDGVHPDAEEACDGVDQDCDDVADDGIAATRWTDADGDGWGDGDAPLACDDLDEEAATQAGDCDDADAGVHPGADEVCDDVDQDCDDVVDDGASNTTAYADADGDGYGDGNAPMTGCAPLDGAVENDLDCDDGDATVYPGARERLDGRANDCDAVEIDRLGPEDADARLEGEAVGDAAGSALVCPGDLDGDGAADLLVGASGAGRAYLVAGPPTDGSLADARLILDGWDGGALAGGQDLDADGVADVLLGVTGGLALVAGTDTGSAAPAAVTDGSWSEVVFLQSRAGATVTVAGGAGTVAAWWGSPGDGADADLRVDGLGATVRIADGGDLDGDGARDLVVGDVDQDRVYVFEVTHGTFTPDDATATLVAAGTGDRLGAGLAAAGDVDGDGDGQADLLVGAPCVDVRGMDDGTVYVMYGPVRGALGVASAGGWIVGRGGGGQLGEVVLGGVDVSNDGAADILLGLPHGEVEGAEDGGAFYAMTGPVYGETSLSSSGGVVGGGGDGSLIGAALAAGPWMDGGVDLALAAERGEAGAVWVFSTRW